MDYNKYKSLNIDKASHQPILLSIYDVISHSCDAMFIYIDNDFNFKQEKINIDNFVIYILNAMYILLTRARTKIIIYAENTEIRKKIMGSFTAKVDNTYAFIVLKYSTLEKELRRIVYDGRPTYECINEIFIKKLITQEECNFLHKIRETRNSLIHDDFNYTEPVEQNLNELTEEKIEKILTKLKHL
jgi:bifunctional DNA-binding transcriptional regulator/antitoxin component of YhaV-PrlF toxin-antitoxin module